jgi:hypothetical protein
VCEVRGAQCGRRGPDALNGVQHAQRRERALPLDRTVPQTYLRAAAADRTARRARHVQRRESELGPRRLRRDDRRCRRHARHASGCTDAAEQCTTGAL